MLKNKGVSLLLICVLLVNYLPVFPVCAAEEKTKIAVYELSAKGVSSDMGAILSDVLRDTISQTGQYKMLTREDMKQILDNPVEGQNIDLDCGTDKCIAEIAGALGVEKIISGSVGKLGETYVISLRLVDASLAETINTVSSECRCEDDALLAKIKEAGLSLLNLEPKPLNLEPKPTPVVEAEEVTETASSTPPPATVINRRNVAWTSLGIGIAGGVWGLMAGNNAQALLKKADQARADGNDYKDEADKAYENKQNSKGDDLDNQAKDAFNQDIKSYDNYLNTRLQSEVGYAIAGIFLTVATYCFLTLPPKEPKKTVLLPDELSVRPRQVSLSWRF